MVFETPINEIVESLGKGWARALRREASKDYFLVMLSTLAELYDRGTKLICPAEEDIFNAFKLTPLEKVSVVIVGQDPYHTPGHAHGLAFSTKSEKRPPSLDNIFHEILGDLNSPRDPRNLSNDLTPWAEQGVLLLNTVLTVDAGEPKSHAGLGWEAFTDHVLKGLFLRTKPTVFMLWGAEAKKKLELCPVMMRQRHLILTAAHPSPYSAEGFFGCRHFSKANDFLTKKGFPAIEWTALTK